MILAQFTWLILKNIYGIKFTAFFEMNWLSVGLLIIAGCAHNLLSNKHLRIQSFYKKTSAKKQAIINLLGAVLFVIPTSALIFGLSWEFFLSELGKHQFLFSLDAFSDPSSLRIIGLCAFVFIIIFFTHLTALAGISMASKAGLTLHKLKSEIFVKTANESRKA